MAQCTHLQQMNLRNRDMIEWRTDKPQGDIIVAKIKEDFCYKKDYYDVLHFVSKPYPYYSDAWCEEVPFSVIEKWALIK